METEATKLLEDLRVMLEKGGQFIVEQAPPLAQEIIAYGRAWYTGLGLLELTLALCLGWYWLKRSRADLEFLRGPKPSYDVVPPGGIVKIIKLIGFGLTQIIMGISAICDLRTALLAWAAPRLFLLEYVMDLLRPRGGH